MKVCRVLASFLDSCLKQMKTIIVFCMLAFFLPYRKIPAWKTAFTHLYLPNLNHVLFESCPYSPLGRAQSVAKLPDIRTRENTDGDTWPALTLSSSLL